MEHYYLSLKAQKQKMGMGNLYIRNYFCSVILKAAIKREYLLILFLIRKCSLLFNTK